MCLGHVLLDIILFEHAFTHAFKKVCSLPTPSLAFACALSLAGTVSAFVIALKACRAMKNLNGRPR